MTASEVLFDTWSRWELLKGSDCGARLRSTYLEEADAPQILTSTISLGEISARLASAGKEASIVHAALSIRNASLLLDVTPELATRADPLRARLPQRHRSASLADAIVLASARSRDARVLSGDSALLAEPDVASR